MAGEDFLSLPSLNVAGRVSSMKSVACWRLSSMNEMRLGRSLELTLRAWGGLLVDDLVCSDGVLNRESRAG